MTDLRKRSLLKTAALSALAATALVACGKKDEPAPAPAVVAPPAARPVTDPPPLDPGRGRGGPAI